MHGIIQTIATWIIPVAAATILHDFAQATVARWMGDSAAAAWRPHRRILAHLDPLGSVVVPLALATVHAPVFGWGKPVPLTVSEARTDRIRLAAVALTGPVACVIHAVLGAVALGALVAAMGG